MATAKRRVATCSLDEYGRVGKKKVLHVRLSAELREHDEARTAVLPDEVPRACTSLRPSVLHFGPARLLAKGAEWAVERRPLQPSATSPLQQPWAPAVPEPSPSRQCSPPHRTAFARAASPAKRRAPGRRRRRALRAPRPLPFHFSPPVTVGPRANPLLCMFPDGYLKVDSNRTEPCATHGRRIQSPKEKKLPN